MCEDIKYPEEVKGDSIKRALGKISSVGSSAVMCKCMNCGTVTEISKIGDCPECGAFAYIIKKEGGE